MSVQLRPFYEGVLTPDFVANLGTLYLGMTDFEGNLDSSDEAPWLGEAKSALRRLFNDNSPKMLTRLRARVTKNDLSRQPLKLELA